MRTTFTRLASGLATLAGSTALFCGMGQAASAQYHAVYGGGAKDVAQGGIIETGTGEFIAVGYSDSFGADRDLYVVMTDKCGALMWSRTYDIGGIDEGKKIREAPNGDFVIIGNTENLNNCCTRNDAFLMEIDPSGNVVWVNTMGGIDDDQGADVKIFNNTYYFAGRTNSFGRGDYDGWLGAVDPLGNLLWSRLYGGDQADGFNALDFSNCNGGSIIASGDTRSYTANGDLDIYAMMTDFGGIPLGGWPFHYGSGLDDAAWSILADGQEIYIAGYTEGAGNGRDGYILHLDCNGNRVDDMIHGGGGTGFDDELTEIGINQFNGNLTLTGFMQDPFGGFGGYDVWLMELDPGLGFIFSRIYGGSQDDQGWSIAVTSGISAQWDYVMAGWSDSYGVFGSLDLYQIRADQNGKSGCNESDPQLWRYQPGYDPQSSPSWWPQARVICATRVEPRDNDMWKWICSGCALFLKSPGGDSDLSLHDGSGDGGAYVSAVPWRRTK